MSSRTRIGSRNGSGGYVLLEALIAVLIFSIGILGMIGMQAAAVKSVDDAKFRADAAMAADQIIAQMWVDQTHLATYVATNAPLTGSDTNLPGGMKTITVDGNTVTVTISWRPPNLPASEPPHQFVTETQITS